MCRAVFLDRDGTINALVDRPGKANGDSPRRPEEFQLLPGVGEAIGRVRHAGIRVVIASNQPGVANGELTLDELDAVTEKMHRVLARYGVRIDAVLYCTHHPEAILQQYRTNCGCRKPNPGLLEEGARNLGIDLKSSFMVGDSLKDIQAGQIAGCRTVLLRGGWHEVGAWAIPEGIRADWIAEDLPAAIEWILRAPQ